MNALILALIMAARLTHSVCLSCQLRRRIALACEGPAAKNKQLHTALMPSDYRVPLPPSTTTNADTSTAVGLEGSIGRGRQSTDLVDLRDAALGLDALWIHRDARLSILRTLSNPWPQAPSGRQSHFSKPLVLPEANGAPVPHSVFRQRIKDASHSKVVRQILRAQLLRCEWPRDILRVIAVAMLNKTTAESLSKVHYSIMRALYRSRQNASDPKILKVLSAIITRLYDADVKVEPQLLFMALKFAARARGLSGMKKHLKLIKDAGLGISSNNFRSVIAKFSIGHRGLGEIRNGRWKRAELQQVLTGFDDTKHLLPEQQYHLGSFLDRNDWQYLHGWVAVLARCKDSKSIWREWELWKKSKARLHPRKLLYREGQFARAMTSKARGDYWFVEQMAFSGDCKKAWEILYESEVQFRTLKTGVKDILLEIAGPESISNEEMRREILAKYDRDLSKIETSLGVRWVKAEMGGEGEGHHELFMDQEEAMERLGAADWKPEHDYGYPYETDPIVPDRERSLHNAVEAGIAT